MRKIVVAHLFNDFSGSPLVLSQVLRGFIAAGHEIDLYTSKSSGDGFLSEIDGVKNYYYPYKWHPNKWITLLRFMAAQIGLLFRLRKYKGEDVVIYVNTVLPFGAALAGRILSLPVIYHIHETSVQPALFKKFLFSVVSRCSKQNIYVSKFLADQEPVQGVKSQIIYNAISPLFLDQVEISQKDSFIVLMLCSLKEYKGIWPFIKAAEACCELQFELVLNAEQYEIDNFFAGKELPFNLKIYSAQSNVHPFYQRASLVVNLSIPDQWIETFGMTALESFAYHLPFIGPPVGGIVEVVEDGFAGFLVDSRDQQKLNEMIKTLASDSELYRKLQSNTQHALDRFSENVLREQTNHLVENI